MNKAPDLNQLNEEQLRALAAQLQDKIQAISLENDKLKHEMAVLKRHKYARTSEALNPHQRSLLDELTNEDIAAIEEQLEIHSQKLQPEKKEKSQPKRAPLPRNYPARPSSMSQTIRSVSVAAS